VPQNGSVVISIPGIRVGAFELLELLVKVTAPDGSTALPFRTTVPQQAVKAGGSQPPPKCPSVSRMLERRQFLEERAEHFLS
jgi:hypothetical protein